MGCRFFGIGDADASGVLRNGPMLTGMTVLTDGRGLTACLRAGCGDGGISSCNRDSFGSPLRHLMRIIDTFI